MSTQVQVQGNLQITDLLTGVTQLSKVISGIYPLSSVNTFAESLNIGTSPTTIFLPVTPTQVVFIHNLHATQTVTVTWTPNGGTSAAVCTLQPNGVIFFLESNAVSGITALSLQASGANTNVDYVLAG